MQENIFGIPRSFIRGAEMTETLPNCGPFSYFLLRSNMFHLFFDSAGCSPFINCIRSSAKENSKIQHSVCHIAGTSTVQGHSALKLSPRHPAVRKLISKLSSPRRCHDLSRPLASSAGAYVPAACKHSWDHPPASLWAHRH